MPDQRLVRFLLYAGWASIGVLALLALIRYQGQAWVYLLFSITGNALLYLGFRRDAIFFDAFLGGFFWLGFWFKLSWRVAFFEGRFNEAWLGHFDGSPAAFDRALLAASCAFLGLLLVRLLRARLFVYPERIEHRDAGLFAFYREHRTAALVGFCLLVVAIAASNAWLGIYQRGNVPRTVLPFGLNGVYSWLLLFGLASVSALILHFEFRLRRETSYLAVVLSLLETFLSNVSLLSRGMLFNASALGYGALRSLKPDGIRTRLRFWLVSFAVFVVLFMAAVPLVQYLRTHEFETTPQASAVVGGEARQLLLDRWIGIEGLMSVSGHPRQGWELWHEAWQERPAAQLSFYDRNFVTSSYTKTDFSRYRFQALPGIVAFCFYPGSFLFLFACMALVGAIAAAVEWSVFRLGGRNLVLCALLAQVVASRYVHFGFAPAQSYLLFGALYLNLLLIYFADRLLVARARA